MPTRYPITMQPNDITYKIIGAAYKVHTSLGPGLLESIYEAAMCYELRKQGLSVEKQVPAKVFYDGQQLPIELRIDLLIEDTVIIELKSVQQLTDLHHKQLLTYLKITNKPIGLLINFNSYDIRSGISRIVNNFHE